MSYPVPNSDDPALVNGKDEKILRGWDLLMYKCRQQPLVPIGTILTIRPDVLTAGRRRGDDIRVDGCGENGI
jgi:hypothetical protein